MLSKNNVKMLTEKNVNKRQRFGLRKLTVGVASVLLGTTFFMGTQVAQADALASSSTEEQAVSQQVTSTAKDQPATTGNAVQLTKQTPATSTEGGVNN